LRQSEQEVRSRPTSGTAFHCATAAVSGRETQHRGAAVDSLPCLRKAKEDLHDLRAGLQDGITDRAAEPGQAFRRDRTNVLAFDPAIDRKPSRAALYRHMTADPLVTLSDRKQHHKFRRAMVELIDRDDERRPAPALLVSHRIAEIDIPGIAPGRLVGAIAPPTHP
jgi:hypothetical protein